MVKFGTAKKYVRRGGSLVQVPYEYQQFGRGSGKKSSGFSGGQTLNPISQSFPLQSFGFGKTPTTKSTGYNPFGFSTPFKNLQPLVMPTEMGKSGLLYRGGRIGWKTIKTLWKAKQIPASAFYGYVGSAGALAGASYLWYTGQLATVYNPIKFVKTWWGKGKQGAEKQEEIQESGYGNMSPYVQPTAIPTESTSIPDDMKVQTDAPTGDIIIQGGGTGQPPSINISGGGGKVNESFWLWLVALLGLAGALAFLGIKRKRKKKKKKRKKRKA
jgi:hypothetical protein